MNKHRKLCAHIISNKVLYIDHIYNHEETTNNVKKYSHRSYSYIISQYNGKQY